MLRKVILFYFILFTLLLEAQPVAFISGTVSFCDNSNVSAEVKIQFIAPNNPPYSFVYEIDGVPQPKVITNVNPYIIFTQQVGVYKLNNFSDRFLEGDVYGEAVVSVNFPPTAIINCHTDTLSVLFPEMFFFSDSSKGSIIKRNWNFGYNTDTLTYNYYHIFPVDNYGIGIPSIYEIRLIVEDDKHCMDTATHQVLIREEYYMYMPNAFTPDEDNKNDRFCIDYHAIREQTFLFNVYTLLGELIYQTNNPEELNCSLKAGWDGKHYITNNDLPSGNYVCEIYYQDFEGWKYNEYGSITLIR